MSSVNSVLRIRPATEADFDAIWPITRAVVEPGDTYALPRDCSREGARSFWFAPGVETFVAIDDSAVPARVVGAYLLKPNQPAGGPGAHVANAAYMVDPGARGKGVGRAMGEHSLATARARGYRAMQFNFVVSTNDRAVALWKDLGFAIVGTIPGAFNHPTFGFVDAYVMHRTL